MDCPACGAPNEDDALFCGSCGTTLSLAAQPPTTGGEAEQETLSAVTAAIEEGREPVREPAPEESGTETPSPVGLPAVYTLAPAQAPEAEAPRPQPRGSAYAPPAATVPTSGLAIAALVLGIGGLTFLPLLGSILAVILGPMARSEIRRRPDQLTGDGVALVGMVLGWIGIGLTVLGLLLFGAITVCALVGVFGFPPAS